MYLLQYKFILKHAFYASDPNIDLHIPFQNFQSDLIMIIIVLRIFGFFKDSDSSLLIFLCTDHFNISSVLTALTQPTKYGISSLRYTILLITCRKRSIPKYITA